MKLTVFEIVRSSGIFSSPCIFIHENFFYRDIIMCTEKTMLLKYLKVRYRPENNFIRLSK